MLFRNTIRILWFHSAVGLCEVLRCFINLAVAGLWFWCYDSVCLENTSSCRECLSGAALSFLRIPFLTGSASFLVPWQNCFIGFSKVFLRIPGKGAVLNLVFCGSRSFELCVIELGVLKNAVGAGCWNDPGRLNKYTMSPRSVFTIWFPSNHLLPCFTLQTNCP